MPIKGSRKPASEMKSRYRKIKVDGKTVSLHRYIVEKLLGRLLLPGEVVHHINGDKLDNRPENLKVMDASEHSRLENIGRTLTEEHKAKVRKSLIGNQRRKGVPHSSEIKEKISKSMKNARGKHPEWWAALFTKNPPK
jgi:hypothetical protein